MVRRFVLVTLVAVGLTTAGQVLIAQSEKAADGTAQAEQKTERRGPLPFYFGKLGLSDEQKEKMYGIQDEYEVKLEALRQQIIQLEGERDQKLEAMLTPGQKLRLKELREEAAREAEAKEKAGEKE